MLGFAESILQIIIWWESKNDKFRFDSNWSDFLADPPLVGSALDLHSSVCLSVCAWSVD